MGSMGDTWNPDTNTWLSQDIARQEHIQNAPEVEEYERGMGHDQDW